MRKTFNYEEYITEQMENAQELDNSTCTLFAKDEKALESKLTEMGIPYSTPRRGQYFVAVR